MDLATLSAITVIIGFICTAFNYIVIAPLRASIETLRISIDKLSAGLEDIREKQHAIKVQIAEIEAQGKSNSHRIDEMAEVINRLQERRD